MGPQLLGPMGSFWAPWAPHGLGPMGPWVHGPYQILKKTYQILKETYQILRDGSPDHTMGGGGVGPGARDLYPVWDLTTYQVVRWGGTPIRLYSLSIYGPYSLGEGPIHNHHPA